MRFATQMATCQPRTFHAFSHRFERPLPPSVGKRERLGEMLDEVSPGDLYSAEPRDMRRRLLTVDKSEVPGLKLLDEPHEGHFGCIIDSGKHRLGKEGASNRHAIQSADEATILPCLDGMGIAEFVQARVGVQHFICDPGSSFGILLARPCTLFHHVPEADIKRDGVHILAKPSPEAAGDMELIGKQHGARIGRPPENRLIVVVPGKDALSIGFE